MSSKIEEARQQINRINKLFKQTENTTSFIIPKGFDSFLGHLCTDLVNAGYSQFLGLNFPIFIPNNTLLKIKELSEKYSVDSSKIKELYFLAEVYYLIASLHIQANEIREDEDIDYLFFLNTFLEEANISEISITITQKVRKENPEEGEPKFEYKSTEKRITHQWYFEILSECICFDKFGKKLMQRKKRVDGLGVKVPSHLGVTLDKLFEEEIKDSQTKEGKSNLKASKLGKSSVPAKHESFKKFYFSSVADIIFHHLLHIGTEKDNSYWVTYEVLQLNGFDNPINSPDKLRAIKNRYRFTK